YRVLVLADAAALSTAQCDAIRQYVQRGGSLVATFASSLFDEYGVRRADFGLADVFGVSLAGRDRIVEGPMHNSYLNLEADAAGRRHPLLAGLEGTPRIINGVFRGEVSDRGQPGVRRGSDGGQTGVGVQSAPSLTPPPLTLIPQYPDLPMEDVYPRVP